METPSVYDQLAERIRNQPDKPNLAWLNETAQTVLGLTLMVESQQIVTSPDGAPYLALHMPKPDESRGSVAVEAALEYCVQNSLGMAVYSVDGTSLLAFTHGNLLAWKLYGKPYTTRFWDAPDDVTGPETVSEPEQVLVGAPNEQMLPSLVRNSLRTVMKERFGISEPRVGLIARPSENGISRVVFDLDPDKLGGDDAAFTVYRKLCWYLPYAIPHIHIPSMAGAPWMIPV